MQTIKITQIVKRTNANDYNVKMIVEDDEKTESYEYNFENTNAIYPRYKALFEIMRNYKDVHIELITDNKIFIGELNGRLNKNTRLYEILNELKREKGVEVDAIFIENN